MGHKTISDDGARTSRQHWFEFLDSVEPVRQDLFNYCQRLTHTIWDAEDLVQDTLLTGFAMIARGDFHGERSPVRNVKAYLFRTATNRWLDHQRKFAREVGWQEETASGTTDVDPTLAVDALRRSIGIASTQEFCAILLKDVYDFSLDEIADFIGTTPGTVKSALSRARRKLQEGGATSPVNAQQRALAEQFASAMNAHDVDAVKALMAEEVQIQVCNVGGGRGRDGIWTSKTMVSIWADWAEIDGEAVVLLFRDQARTLLDDVLRLAGEQAIVRLIDHCYAPETLHHVARQLGLRCEAKDYHQPWDVIESSMVPTTFLPWRTD